MENIEIRIVTDIILLRIEHARSIQGIRIRVDVEIALHLARYIVGRGAERSGRFLLTVRTVGNQVERKGVRDIIRRIEIGRITGNLAGLRPSRIEKGADRRIVGGLLGTRSDTYRMRVHDRILEKLLEPVRVAVLGLAQVAVARLHGVFKQSGIDQRIHLAVNTARRRVGDTRIAQPALVVQLLIDGHLVLRVHDVEIGVGGNHTIRELARIIDMADASTSLFGRNDDHAGHSARTVDRGGRTVLQDIETLDILGVQTRDGGTDQRRGVTRREVLSRNIGDILHNYAVHNPKRLRAAVNRRRTADADLGSGTESTRYVLHRDTGRTAFQTAADIGHTRKFHILGGKAVRRTRKETFVGLGHTRNHDGLDSLLVRNKGNLHVRTDLHILRNIPQIGDLQFLGFRRNIVHNEKSLLIGGYTDGRTFDDNRSADHGRSVFINDTTAHLFGLGECPRCKHKYSN